MKTRNFNLKNFVVVLVLFALAACGGGGDGGGGLEAPVANLSGTWKITTRTISNDCGEENGINSQSNFKITQDGNNLTVTDDEGNVFKGTISGSKVAWSGSFPEDGGTTTITELSLTVFDGGKSLSGTSSWTWTDGSSGCQGKTSVSGILTASSGGTVGGGETVIRNVAGTWSITEVAETNRCTVSRTPITYQVTITQNGSNITVVASFGSWEGTITGNLVSWEGTSNGITRENMSLILSTKGQSLAGELGYLIQFNNPIRFCGMRVSLTGTKI